jgi:hypothetical protein
LRVIALLINAHETDYADKAARLRQKSGIVSLGFCQPGILSVLALFLLYVPICFLPDLAAYLVIPTLRVSEGRNLLFFPPIHSIPAVR